MNDNDAIHYRIQPYHPEAHLYRVELTVAQTQAGGQLFTLPAWIPGSYMIRDFARNIVRIEAQCDGHAVALEKIDKQSWQAAPCSGPLTLRYEVYAWDLSVRSAHLDQTHAYFNGTSVFLQVVGREQEACRVTLFPPEGVRYADWRVATTLPRLTAEAYAFGDYLAANYDELIDHPVEMGTFSLIEFEAGGIPHAVALTGRHFTDGVRVARDLKKICEYQINLFGAPAPMDQYLFQVMAVDDGYGGLEHRASTSLLSSRNALPRVGEAAISDEYRTFLGLCSHEYFHSWNVKRIKPDVFLPYDLSQESHTPLLWAFEGFTAYYDDLSLVRCGLIAPESYLELLGQVITRVLRGSGRLKQSVTASSFDTWTKFYKQDENAPNAIVSYYTKGSLVALCLDLIIRRESQDKRSLDDLMRALWERHGKIGVGVTQEGLEALINEIAATDLTAFLDMALRGTGDLPLAALLAEAGIVLNWRPASGLNDKGGKANGGTNGEKPPRIDLGVRIGKDPAGARLLHVFDGGSAQGAGLSAGDLLIAIDGLRCTADNLEALLGYFQPGQTVTLHAFRRDELLNVEVPLTAATNDTVYLTPAAALDEVPASRRQAWLGQPFGDQKAKEKS